MKAAILSVGTELLFGQITNTNSVFLSRHLNMLGFDVLYHYTVGDNPARLEEILKLAYRDCDLVITTGGLGPTQDDLTKEVVAQVFHDYLVTSEESLSWLEDYFRRNNRVMTDNNRKQANLPSRAILFHNDAGTAPGFALEEDNRIVICLPGPPREMSRMFLQKALPYLETKTDGIIYHKSIRTFGIGESQLETTLLELIDSQTDPTLATYAKEGECSLRIASKRKTLREAEEAVAEMIERIKPLIGEFIYSTEDEELVEVVGRLLMEKEVSVSCAESCTGGLFAGALSSIPGISKVFDRGLVTYSNRAKVEELGVSPGTLEEFGAVSRETALEMARGLNEVTGSRLCVSITGIAGPEGGSEIKPVGLSYVGIVLDGRESVTEIRSRNVNRNWNRNYSVLAMLHLIYKLLIDMV